MKEDLNPKKPCTYLLTSFFQTAALFYYTSQMLKVKDKKYCFLAKYGEGETWESYD